MSVLDRFRPVVSIHASPDEFRFTASGGEVRMRTLIRLSEERKIIEIGEGAEHGADGGTLVRIFERPEGARRSDWFDRDAFVRFCRYGVTLALQAALPLAPRVEVLATRQLDRLFGGTAADILGPLVREAGAAHVTYAIGQ